MAETAVGLQGVIKHFGDVTAVRSLDLDIADGEFFSLLGPSGCGKTTTLRMIAGLEFPTQGSISIYGEEMGLRPPNKRPVNTVFQSYALFPHMSVAENVSFGLRMQKFPADDTQKRVAEVIELVRLGGMESRKPKQLSGGQQQRVALARALVNQPKVLLLDEPLGALDLKLRQAMQVELKEIQRRVGITFVYVTHDQEEALTMSDRIGVMNEGELLQVGPSEEIYEQPSNRFVADFIGETNFLDGEVVTKGEVKLTTGRVVRARTRSPSGTSVTLTLRPEKLHLYGLEQPIPSDVNELNGTIANRLYYGDSFYYDVDVGAGAHLECRVENIPSLPRWEVGDEVRVTFHPEAAEALTK